MRFARAVSHGHVIELNLTPMVDVVFQLIVFFIATAQFVYQSQVPIDLPAEKGDGTAQVEVAPLEINVLSDAANPYVVDGQRTSLAGVVQWADERLGRLQQEGRDVQSLEITVRAERAAPSAAVNDVGRVLQARGITRWRLAVRQP